jgi:hypothetical protein
VEFLRRHLELRYNFEQDHRNWTQNQWDRYSIKNSIFIILKSCNFQDEKIIPSCPSGRVWVYRPKSARYNPEYFNQNSHSGRFSIKLHGYDSGHGHLGTLTRMHENLNLDKYCEELREIFPVIIDEFPDNDHVDS